MGPHGEVSAKMGHGKNYLIRNHEAQKLQLIAIEAQRAADGAQDEAQRIADEAVDDSQKTANVASEEAKKAIAEAEEAAAMAQKAADKAFEEIGVSKEAADSIKSRLLKTKQVEEAHLKCCITNSTEDCDVLILKSLSYQFKAKI